MKKPKLNHLLHLSSDRFRGWSNNSIGEELSTLQLPISSLLRQVYPDACDAGFVVVSKRTGVEQLFLLARELTDRDGDELQGWEFHSLDSQRGETGKYKITIFND